MILACMEAVNNKATSEAKYTEKYDFWIQEGEKMGCTVGRK